jgi:hypothetical protein
MGKKTMQAAEAACASATEDQELDDSCFRIKGHIRLPTLKVPVGKPIFFRVMEEPVTKPKLDRDGDQKTDDEGNPATITTMHIVELKSREHFSIVCNVALVQAFKELQGGTVGRCFRVLKHEKPDGKRWMPIDIAEIEDPDTIHG